MKSTKNILSTKNKEDLWDLLISLWGNFNGQVKVTGYHSIKPAHQNDNIGTGTKLEVITGMNYHNLRGQITIWEPNQHLQFEILDAVGKPKKTWDFRISKYRIPDRYEIKMEVNVVSKSFAEKVLGSIIYKSNLFNGLIEPFLELPDTQLIE